VARIYPALDVLSRSATFEVFLPPGEALRPGMVVTMEVFLEEAEGILIVPRQALRRVRGIEGVFIAQDGVAAWRPVETGSAQGRGVSVLSGLVAGDAVIVTPNPQLQEGRAIRVWEGSP
jgi:hypothetical protein